MITEQFKDKNNQIYTSIGLSKAKDLTLNYPHLPTFNNILNPIFEGKGTQIKCQSQKCFQAENFRLNFSCCCLFLVYCIAGLEFCWAKNLFICYEFSICYF